MLYPSTSTSAPPVCDTHDLIRHPRCSRSGEPTWSAVTASPDPPPWSQTVSWQKADALKPSTYHPLLKDADAVVHSTGILLEADYKGVLQGKESVVSGLQRAFSSTKSGSQNPLTRRPGEDLQPQERDGQLTYELMNRDTGLSILLLRSWILLTSLVSSNHLGPRGCPTERPNLCVHLGVCRSTDPARSIYQHQARSRIDNRLEPASAAQHIHPARVPLRQFPVVDPAHCRHGRVGRHRECLHRWPSDLADRCRWHQTAESGPRQ